MDDLADADLNAGNKQRLVLIAANFRKEVTATALWLLGHGVSAKCFRIVPYSNGQELFIDLRQIIPIPEAADYMIGMAAKDSEEESDKGARNRSHTVRLAFWTKALEQLRVRKVSRFENISPSGDHWLTCATGVSGCIYNLIFLKNEARVELNLQRSVAEENKQIFDQLRQERQDIEHRFGEELQWLRLDERKACRICFSHPYDSFNEENWPEMIDWLCSHVVRLDEAFSEPLKRLNSELKSAGDTPANDWNAPPIVSNG